MLITNKQVSRRRAFANNLSPKIKLSKTQLHKIGYSGRFLGRHLGQFLKSGLPLLKNVLKPLAKSVLIPLGLRAVTTATVATIYKKMFGSGTTTLIISNEEMNDMKIVKSLAESGLLIKGVIKTVKNEAWEQKGQFLNMLLRKLGATLLGNLLTSKGVKKSKIRRQGVMTADKGTIATNQGCKVNMPRQGTTRAGQDF